eukprot:COSAG05_NODE_759_length_7489_cov_110.169959_1_plen_95_part_00
MLPILPMERLGHSSPHNQKTFTKEQTQDSGETVAHRSTRSKRGAQTSDKAQRLIKRLLENEENLMILHTKSELGSSINTNKLFVEYRKKPSAER